MYIYMFRCIYTYLYKRVISHAFICVMSYPSPWHSIRLEHTQNLRPDVLCDTCHGSMPCGIYHVYSLTPQGITKYIMRGHDLLDLGRIYSQYVRRNSPAVFPSQTVCKQNRINFIPLEGSWLINKLDPGYKTRN